MSRFRNRKPRVSQIGTASVCYLPNNVTDGMVLDMLHSFVTWVVAGILALIAIVKAKAIHAACKKATDAGSKKFWEWVHSRASLAARDRSEQKYKGIFVSYWYRSTPGPMWFLKFSNDGVETTVRINESPMLETLKAGMLVEIDTVVRPDHTYESIKRVHVIK